jgi:hypothetical protein
MTNMRLQWTNKIKKKDLEYGRDRTGLDMCDSQLAQAEQRRRRRCSKVQNPNGGIVFADDVLHICKMGGFMPYAYYEKIPGMCFCQIQKIENR